jgi:hypothetical protein
MAFRSSNRLLVSAGAVLVPLALSCSSSSSRGDDNPAAPAFNQGSLPNQPASTPESPADPGTATSPGTEPSATGSNGEGLPGGVPIAQAQPTPAAGPGTEGTVPATTTMVTPTPVVVPLATENTGSACTETAGVLARNNNLPDPFKRNDGTRISTRADWECRRNEIKRDIETFEIGPKPDPSTVTVAATLANNTLNVAVTTQAGSIQLTSPVTVQGMGNGPHCVGIGMDNASGLIKGCTLVTFQASQVVMVNQNGNINLNDPFYTVYPELRSKISNYAAWSWGVSRIIDGLDQVKDQLNIDMSKIAVHGCSYAGKMALFSGAFDERVALTLAQESGGGGINSWRLSQNFVTRTGTQIEKIDNTNYSWFMQSMKGLDPYSLPHDHHELIAMIAPRAFVTFGNRDYEWLGDESGYKSVKAAQEVFNALGAGDKFGYDFTTGHTHCTPAQSQVNTANAFVNKFLLGQDANTNIAIPPNTAPSTAGQATFDLDQTKVIDWTTPTLQ